MTNTPPRSFLTHFQSSDWEPAQRRDAWSELAHRWVDFYPAAEVPLQAQLSILASEACTLGSTCSSAYEMRTGSHRAQPDDMVVLTLMQSGGLQPEMYGRKGPGALSLCAPREAGRFRWEQGARQVFLTLSRSDAAAALGQDPATQLLSARGVLAPLLSSQMNHLALLLRQGGHADSPLDATEYASLLDATRALALLTLRNLGRHAQQRRSGTPTDPPDTTASDSESLHMGRRAAALRYMELHAHRSELSAADIAHGAGCSRTRLYEAFATEGGTVMDALRTLRLQRARAFIEQSERLNVGALAWRCGFASPSGFAKLFKAFFGLSPTEWHRHTRHQGR